MPPEPTAVASLLDEQTSRVARQIAASWELSDRVLEALDEQRSERIERPPLRSAARCNSGDGSAR